MNTDHCTKLEIGQLESMHYLFLGAFWRESVRMHQTGWQAMRLMSNYILWPLVIFERPLRHSHR